MGHVPARPSSNPEHPRSPAMNIATHAGLALVASSLLGCGSHDRALDILASAPAGTLGGASWTMQKATVQNSGGTLNVTLFGEAVPDCSSSGQATKPYVRFSAPAQVGERALQFSFDFTD